MLKIALAGNPNSGKTTLFNCLTGSTARVGNWPGVTVDKRAGRYAMNGETADVIDLPGIYSLSPYTPEETIARGYLLAEKPDVIINVVDVTNLERNLYLTTQLLELDTPLVVALNMTDVLKKRGESIDAPCLQRRLGVPVVEISALKKTNVPTLMRQAFSAAKTPREAMSVLTGERIYEAVVFAQKQLKNRSAEHALFHAVKLVENDGVEQQINGELIKSVRDFLRKVLPSETDAEASIADARYRYITSRLSPLLKKSNAEKEKKADRILTHKWLGIPIFLLILFLLFHITFSKDVFFLGGIFHSLHTWCAQKSLSRFSGIFVSKGIHSPGVVLFSLVEYAASAVSQALAKGLLSVGLPTAVQSFIVDGIWGGVAAVFSFLPQMLLLFLLFGILEDSGYMARAAFMLDKIFRRFGVSGRAFIPMIMGFGCSVPAIMNTRTLQSEQERVCTIKVVPFFACGAKMPLVLALSGAAAQFFGVGNADLITCGAYVIGVAVAFVSLWVFHKHTKSEPSPFIMELPNYRLPSGKNLVALLWDKTKHFIRKTFSVIILSCIAVWFLSNFGWDWKYVSQEGIQNSILASLGKLVSPLFTPLGFGVQLSDSGWVFAVATLAGFIAKEDILATLSTLTACVCVRVSSMDSVMDWTALVSQTGITLPALLAFLAFNLLTVPCFAATLSAKAELGKKHFVKTLCFWLFVSYLVGGIVYTLGLFWWTAFVWLGLFIIFIFIEKNKRGENYETHQFCMSRQYLPFAHGGISIQGHGEKGGKGRRVRDCVECCKLGRNL